MNFLLVDDHHIVRLAMKKWLQDEFPGSEVDEASTAAEAIFNFKKTNYDLAIMDVMMNDSSDFGLLHRVLLLRPEANIIIVSMLSEEIYGVKFLQAGAKSYLSKGVDVTLFITVVKKVLAGGKFVTENVWNILLEKANYRKINPSPFDQLSQREAEVVKLFLSGRTSNEISELIKVHTSTVANHKINSFKKLGVETIVELVNMAKIFHFIYE